MKTFRKVLPKATIMFLLFTALCGIIYTDDGSPRIAYQRCGG